MLEQNQHQQACPCIDDSLNEVANVVDVLIKEILFWLVSLVCSKNLSYDDGNVDEVLSSWKETNLQ